jgi:hypothetical protein
MDTTTQPPKKKLSLGKKILIGIGVLFIIGLIGSQFDKSDKPKTPATSANALSDTTSSVADNPTIDKPNNSDEWNYSEDVDQMDNTKRTIASLKADNTIEFDFPYGNSEFTINVRKWKGSTDVYLYCSSCQFIAGISGEKTYRVKFDDEAPFRVTANYSTDGSSDVVFLGSETKLITKLKTAKKLIIEPEFFDVGFKPVTFSVQGFKW